MILSSKNKISLFLLLGAAAWIVSPTEGQALNNHINPQWVESGRELLARQQESFGAGLGASRLQDYRANPSQTSLYYLDSVGRLRPVFLNDPYRTRGYANGNSGIARSNLFQAAQDPYYIR